MDNRLQKIDNALLKCYNKTVSNRNYHMNNFNMTKKSNFYQDFLNEFEKGFIIDILRSYLKR